MTDENSLGGRVRRYARVGAAVGGLAARYAGGRVLGLPFDAGAHADELRQALGGLKGPLMKVAQIASTIPDVLSPEYAARFTELQANAPPMGWAFVRRRMVAELGPDWPSRFASFEREAAAAASLGQVHRATALEDERPLACKLQYPDMASVVEADLRQLKAIFAIWRRYDKAIDPTEIHAELSARLREELDYRREARHIRLYASILENEPGVAVPETLEDLSTGRLLTMGWLEGRPIATIAEAPLEMRNRVARNLFRAWYLPFYTHGAIHGDPHLGNYTVRPDGTVNLLDFGCIRVFPAPFVRGVIDLYRAVRDGDEALAAHAYETWGFRNLSRDTLRVLNRWAQFLYGPLLKEGARPLDDTAGATYGARVAAKVHKELQSLGGVRPPREFVLMDRAAIGLGSVFLRLKAELDWREMFHDLTGDFDEAALAGRQHEALARFGIPRPE
jgi:predicted unusual protein kinase regulating ubiquinone biosynthesis (AarF/ABC1/UbiB family)